MRTSKFSAFDDNVVLLIALGIGLTVFSTCVCFYLTIVSIGFWRLADGVILWTHPLILILSLKVIDPKNLWIFFGI